MTTDWQAPGDEPVPPTVPAAPRYGEMAPPGYVAPGAVPAAAQPVVAAQPAAAQPTPVAPQYAPPYGQAPVGQVSAGAGQYYQAVPRVRRVRPADIAVTCSLLGIGLIVTLLVSLSAAELPASINDYWARYGLTYHGTTSIAGSQLMMVLSHVILFVIALGGSLPLLITKRVAFWVPLAAGVLAAIFFWAAILALIFSDPALMNAVQQGGAVN